MHQSGNAHSPVSSHRELRWNTDSSVMPQHSVGTCRCSQGLCGEQVFKFSRHVYSNQPEHGCANKQHEKCGIGVNLTSGSSAGKSKSFKRTRKKVVPIDQDFLPARGSCS